MKQLRWIALILLGIILGGFALAEADDPVVVRVGDLTYSKSVAEFAMRATLDVAAVFNGEIDEADKIAVRDSTLERLIGIGVIENKLRECGLNDFTEDERELIMAEARSQYEQTWQAICAELEKQGADVDASEVTAWMDDEGYTVEAFYREALVAEREFRIIERFCADVTVTDEEVARFYEETYVAPEREKYENDIAAYEADALVNGDETFYTPEGYRYIKQIRLEFPEALQEALKPYDRKAVEKLNAARKAYLALADAAATAERWEDIAPSKQAYDDAMAAYDSAVRARQEKQREALGLLEDTTDEIAARYAAGVLFESLMDAYSADRDNLAADDPGVPFHPDSPNWPEDFRNAAAALEKPGDISAPVVTEQGVHIIRYMADMPGGVHELTDQEREALAQAALYSAQVAALQALVEDWQLEYEVEVHPERIDLD